jgi:hypothetical protein
MSANASLIDRDPSRLILAEQLGRRSGASNFFIEDKNELMDIPMSTNLLVGKDPDASRGL